MKSLLLFLVSCLGSFGLLAALYPQSTHKIPSPSSAAYVASPSFKSTNINARLEATRNTEDLYNLFDESANQLTNARQLIRLYDLFALKTEGHEKEALMYNVATRLFRWQPEMGLTWASQQPEPLRSKYIKFGIRVALNEFPIERILSLTSSLEWGDLPVGSIATTIATRSGIEAGIEWLWNASNHKSDPSEDIENLVRFQLAATPDMISKLSPNTYLALQDSIFSEAVDVFARVQPENALDWLASIPDGDAKSSAHQIIFARLAEEQPESVLERFPEIESDPTIMMALGRGWAAKDWSAAFEWAATLDGGNAVLPELFGISKGYAAEASEKLLEVLHEHPELSPEIEESTPRLTHYLLRENPELVQEWLELLPDGKVRDSAFTTYVAELAAIDPIATSEWLLHTPDAPDSALLAFLGHISDDLPALLSWSSRLSERRQVPTLQGYLDDWIAADSSFVKEAIERSPLENHVKESLLRQHFSN